MHKLWQSLWLLASILFTIGIAMAEEPQLPTEGETSQETIAALIRQLGDRNTAKRDIASRRLIEIGTHAKVRLEAASENEDELPVIRRRAKLLLLSITRRERNASWDAFIDGKSATSPPGWEKFRKVVGNTLETRKFFFKMYCAEPELLEAYATDTAKAVSLVKPLCLKRKAAPGDDGDPEIPISSMAAYLLIAGDEDAKMCKRTDAGIFDMTGLNHVLNSGRATFTLALEDGPNKPVHRKLVSRWLSKAKFDRHTARWVMIAATEHDFKEGLQMALYLLGKSGTPEGPELSALDKAIPFYVVGKLGDSTHVEKIEPLLKNPEVLRKLEWNNAQPREVQLCDMALAVLIHLTGQKVEDYGIKNFNESSWDSDSGLLNFWRAVFFSNENERTQAISQWRAWRKENSKDEKAVEAAAASR